MNIKKLHNFRWSRDDNPNGWIEPTTYCNLKCPGCYRGCDQPDAKPFYLSINEAKEQIDWLIKNRNIHTLSIAGGEPLLYPNLDELITYAVGKKLRIMIYTNGVLLDENRLQTLAKLGVTQFLIHIDEYQGRDNIKSIKDVLNERENFCALFRKESQALLGFIQPLSSQSLPSLKRQTDLFTKNRDVISLVVFTLYREIHWEHEVKPDIDTSMEMNQAIEELEKLNYISPATYLKATINSNEPAWLFSYSIGDTHNISGFFKAKLSKFIHNRYYKKHKRHLFISQNNVVSRKGLLKLSFFKDARRVLKRVIFNSNPLYLQTCLVIRGPIFNGKEWDLCNGCPDAILYNKKLVASCILEEIKTKSPTFKTLVNE